MIHNHEMFLVELAHDSLLQDFYFYMTSKILHSLKFVKQHCFLRAGVGLTIWISPA